MKQSDSMLARIRKNSIVELINAQGFITVNNLRERFDVSPATIRNDLRELEAERLIERTHGGAISCRKAVYEPDNREKSLQYNNEKELIAQAALKHIQPGDAIALDTGTTTYQLCRLLSGFERLTVVTYDLQIAAWLESNTDVTIIMAGGLVRRNFHCTSGQTCIETISALHVDKLFLAANAVDDSGLFTPSLEMAGIKAALMKTAKKVYLLADASKLGQKSFARFAQIDQIHTLITNRLAPQAVIARIREKGVNVELV